MKVGIGVLLVVAVGWLPVRTLLQTTSIEAVINARLITLRAPIEGEIGAGLGATTVGMQLEPGAGLMKIVNRRAERGRLDDLHRLINRLESERAGLTSRRNDLEAMHKDLAEQTQAFMDGRSRQLEARTPSSRARSPQRPPTSRKPSARWHGPRRWPNPRRSRMRPSRRRSAM